jgi:hypothetical protein
VIGHPFNPPHLVPLVEVVAGNDTAPATVERALAFYAAIGKRPIRIHREVAGHVANRLQAALWREAVHLVTEGVAHGGRHRHRDQRRAGHALGLEGPYLIFHLAGGSGGIGHFLDQFAGPMEAWRETLGQPHLTAEVRGAIAAGVAAEAAGRSIDELAAERDRLLVAMQRVWGDEPPGGHVIGTAICLSCLLEIGRYGDLIQLLACARNEMVASAPLRCRGAREAGRVGCRDCLCRWLSHAVRVTTIPRSIASARTY